MRKQAIIDINLMENKTLGMADKIIYLYISTYDFIINYEPLLEEKLDLSRNIINLSIRRLIALGYIEKIKINKKEAIRIIVKDNYKKFITEYFMMYNNKAFEIKGTRTNKDGKMYKPRWTAKEGMLLKRDLEEYGYDTLLDYAVIFFNDKVDSVKQFVRKAGYGYTIFHSVIDKIQLANIKVPKKCPYCGYYWGHAKDCKLAKMKIELERKEIEEIKKLKQENPNISLIDMFNKKLGRKVV